MRNKRSGRILWISLFTISLVACACHVAAHGDLEGFDEEESAPAPHAHIKQAAEESEPVPEAAVEPPKADPAGPRSAFSSESSAPVSTPEPIPQQAKYIFETISAILIALYLVAMIWGMRINKGIAEAWTKTFTFKGSVLDKNFSSLGPDSDPVLMKESGNVFKFYATGRRYCQGLLAELTLLPRQDALSMLWNLLSPSEDLIRVEVFMTEDAMPPIVLAIATPKHGRALQRESKDIIKSVWGVSVQLMWMLQGGGI